MSSIARAIKFDSCVIRFALLFSCNQRMPAAGSGDLALVIVAKPKAKSANVTLTQQSRLLASGVFERSDDCTLLVRYLDRQTSDWLPDRRIPEQLMTKQRPHPARDLKQPRHIARF